MIKKISGLLLVILLTISVLAGCGSSKTANESSSNQYTAATTAAMAFGDTAAVVTTSKNSAQNGAADVAVETAAATENQSSNQDSFSTSLSGTTSDNGVNQILDQRKVIRSANITIEVDDFDASYGKINSALLGIGFIQETNINTDRVYIDNVQKLVKHGTIVLRVDRIKFDKVLNGLKEIGAVLSWGIQGEDVTEKYYDTESRLKLLRLEEERVLEYLKKIEDPDKIVTYETRLTSIRHEIESLTGTLRKITDLVDLSTITITMNEKYPGSDKPVIEKTYWDRLGEKFMLNMKGVMNFCGDFIIFIISALPVLILLGLFAWLIIVIYKKMWRSLHSKNTMPPEKSEITQDRENTKNGN